MVWKFGNGNLSFRRRGGGNLLASRGMLTEKCLDPDAGLQVYACSGCDLCHPG